MKERGCKQERLEKSLRPNRAVTRLCFAQDGPGLHLLSLCDDQHSALGAPEVLLRLHPMREGYSQCRSLIKGAVHTHARRVWVQCPDKNVLDLTKF